MAELELRSARLSLDLRDFRRPLSFCWAGRVALVFEDETCHSTHRSRVLRFETCHRLVEGVSPTVMGWSVPAGFRFAWTPLEIVMEYPSFLKMFIFFMSYPIIREIFGRASIFALMILMVQRKDHCDRIS